MSPFPVDKKGIDQIDTMETTSSDDCKWFMEFIVYGSNLSGSVNPLYAAIFDYELSDLGPDIFSRLQFQVHIIYYGSGRAIWSWSQLDRELRSCVESLKYLGSC